MLVKQRQREMAEKTPGSAMKRAPPDALLNAARGMPGALLPQHVSAAAALLLGTSNKAKSRTLNKSTAGVCSLVLSA
jgi:hypothetical protein